MAWLSKSGVFPASALLSLPSQLELEYGNDHHDSRNGTLRISTRISLQ